MFVGGRLARDAAQADLEKLAAQRAVAEWRAVRATWVVASERRYNRGPLMANAKAKLSTRESAPR